MCNTDDFKFLAEMIQHVPLPLRARYIFCCAPINRRMPFVCSMFLKVRIDFVSPSNFPNFLNFHSMHDNTAATTPSPSTGSALKSAGLSRFPKRFLTWFTWKPSLMSSIFTSGSAIASWTSSPKPTSCVTFKRSSMRSFSRACSKSRNCCRTRRRRFHQTSPTKTRSRLVNERASQCEVSLIRCHLKLIS